MKFKKIWKEYRVEIIAGILFLFGIFLLVEQFNIRKTLKTMGNNLLSTFQASSADAGASLTDAIKSISPSDILGFFIIIGVIAFIMWRFRYRYINSSAYLGDGCPICDAELVRVHRKFRDKVFNRVFFVKVHRYRCADKTCGWEGTRKPIGTRRRTSK